MARILDFYDVAWEYEPVTFPIQWDLEGGVVESFSPDFYLPDFDLFLELTTLKQKLVRKKNRKLRRLRELYPDIRIKLFYARDFRAIMLKYGKLGLIGSLSGTLGQVVPDRPPMSEPEGVPVVAEPVQAELAESESVPISAPALRTRRTRSGSERRRRRRAAAMARAAFAVAPPERSTTDRHVEDRADR